MGTCKEGMPIYPNGMMPITGGLSWLGLRLALLFLFSDDMRAAQRPSPIDMRGCLNRMSGPHR